VEVRPERQQKRHEPDTPGRCSLLRAEQDHEHREEQQREQLRADDEQGGQSADDDQDDDQSCTRLIGAAAAHVDHQECKSAGNGDELSEQ
jgi:hypothetical protein